MISPHGCLWRAAPLPGRSEIKRQQQGVLLVRFLVLVLSWQQKGKIILKI